MSTGRRGVSSVPSGSRASSSGYQPRQAGQHNPYVEQSASSQPGARYAPDVNGQMARLDGWALPPPQPHQFAQGNFGGSMPNVPMHNPFTGTPYGYAPSQYPPQGHPSYAQGLQMQGISPSSDSMILNMHLPSSPQFMQPSPTSPTSHTHPTPSRNQLMLWRPQSPRRLVDGTSSRGHEEDNYDDCEPLLPEILRDGWLEERTAQAVRQEMEKLPADLDEGDVSGAESESETPPEVKLRQTVRMLCTELAKERGKVSALGDGFGRLTRVVYDLHEGRRGILDRLVCVETAKGQVAVKEMVKANQHPAMKMVVHNLMRLLMGIKTGNEALGTLPDYPADGPVPKLATGDDMKIPKWGATVSCAENKSYIREIASKALQNVKDDRDSDVPTESQTLAVAQDIAKKYLQHLMTQQRKQGNVEEQKKKAKKDTAKRLHGRRQTLASTRRSGIKRAARLLKVSENELKQAVLTDFCSDRESAGEWTDADRAAATSRGWDGSPAQMRRPPAHRSATATYLYHFLQKCAEEEEGKKHRNGATSDSSQSDGEPSAPDHGSKKRRAPESAGARKRPRRTSVVPLFNGPIGKYLARPPALETSSKSRPARLLVRSSFLAKESASGKYRDYCGEDLPSIVKGLVAHEKKNFQGRSWKFVKHHPSSDTNDDADGEDDTSSDERQIVIREQRKWQDAAHRSVSEVEARDEDCAR